MPKSLKEGEIEELKSRSDIQSILSGYMNLKKTGKSYSGLCPFHKEKTPSFTVDPLKQLYHCFGCGAGGDVINFIMKIENLAFMEAAEFLARKVDYNLKYIHTEGPGKAEKKSRLVELNELAKKYYNYILLNNRAGARALSYLEKRGFKKEIVEKFEVGFCPAGWSNFSEFALKHGFKNAELLDSGLSIQSSKEKDKIYDRFRERIMFPIKDVVGRTIAFGGRIMQDGNLSVNSKNASYMSKAKYINTPETRIYSKSRNIYGIFDSKNSIVDNDRVLIVEGYTDVMAIHQAGINYAVASLGTALTTEQVEIIGRFTKNFILVFDSDTAGMSASMRGIERLKEYNERLDLFHESNIDMRVAILEPGFDPADYIFKKGNEAFLDTVKNSINIIDFTINMILKKYNIENLNEKLRASSELIDFISTLSSKIVQEDCIMKISQKLNLKESLLIEQLVKTMQKKSIKFFDKSQNEKTVNEFYPIKNLEIEALKIIVNGIGKKFNDLLDIGEQYFKFEDCRDLYVAIREKIKNIILKGEAVNFPVGISSNKLESEAVKKLYNLIVFSKVNYSDNDMASVEIYNNLKKAHIADEIETLKNQLKRIEVFKKNLKKTEIPEEQLVKIKKAEDKTREIIIRINDLENKKREFI